MSCKKVLFVIGGPNDCFQRKDSSSENSENRKKINMCQGSTFVILGLNYKLGRLSTYMIGTTSDSYDFYFQVSPSLT